MVEFVTLLLGLVAGTQAVEVTVGDEVARVELRLDGELVETLDAPPWAVRCDFGNELAPHELTAVAFDAGGRELTTSRQWINLPRERIEARLTLDRHADGRTSARLIWTSVERLGEPSVALTLDGEPLAVVDPDAVALPPHDPEELHFLRATLRFSAGESAAAELVFGGSFGEEVATELTALPVLADQRLPKVEEMDGWFEKGGRTATGRPLRVVAVERGPVNLLIVRERSLSLHNDLRFLHQRFEAQRTMTRLPRPAPTVLDDDDRVRFVFPTLGREAVAVRHGLVRLATEQVPVSLPLRVEKPRAPRLRQTPRPGQAPAPAVETPGFRSLFEILTNAFYTVQEAPAPTHQLADAVAIAGLTAAAGDQRRLVLLVVSGESTDDSRFQAADVRGYLRKLGVPLVTWSVPAGSATTVERALARWGETEDVSGLKAVSRALDRLRETLQSQALVWIEGAHLRHEITLTDRARGLRPIAGEPVADEPAVQPVGAAPETPAEDGWRTARIGPYTLRTQVGDRGLIELLDRAAGDHRRLFVDRYGVSRETPIAAEVLLFDKERDFLEFKRVQGHAQAEVRAGGYFEAPALVALHRGRDLRQEVAGSLLHELTHLLSWHLLGEGSSGRRALPAWLEEGLADDMSLAAVDRRRGLVAAPLGPGNLAYGRRLGDVLAEVEGKLDDGRAPPLSELVDMDRTAFLAGDSQLHYLLSALWVRYFLDGADSRLAAGFRGFLKAAAAGGDAGWTALRARLGSDQDELERGFRGWLAQQRRRLPASRTE